MERQHRSTKMKPTSADRNFRQAIVASAVVWVCVCVPVVLAGQQPSATQAPAATAAPTASSGAAATASKVMTFNTQGQAAKALVGAADQFDTPTLIKIFGPGGDDIVFSGEVVQDRQRAVDFAAEAHEKMTISVDPKSGNRAFMLVGNEAWPFPVPIVRVGDKW